MPQPITQCRICGNRDLATVLELGTQKLTGVFPDCADAALVEGPLDLVRCAPDGGVSACGLLQLRHSYPLEAMYGSNYGYRSGLNSSMVRHLTDKVAALVKLAQPAKGDLVVDIGSNDGTLLKCYDAELRLAGIDPVAKKFLSFYPPHIPVWTEFFSGELWRKAFGEAKAKIVTSIAMFYDIEQPLSFMQEIAGCLAEDGIWHFEQSYMPLMIEHLAYDTICHEHIEYYALQQILWMTQRSGLKIIALEKSAVNGGSLSVTAALASSPYPEATNEIGELLESELQAGFAGMEPFWRFRERVYQHRDDLRKVVLTLLQEGKKVLGYGASTKGNVLLQFCGFTPAELPCIAEVNPEKFGKYTPGTGISIVSEDEMHAMKPDVLLVLPWHFRENLIERESAFLARGGKLLFPLPRIEFYPA